jgi:predicted nucleic acid-binding protein
VVVLDYGAVRAAIELCSTSNLSFWDALVVVAAARSGAKRLYTEDLQNGQMLLGVEVVNPFRGSQRTKR